MLVLLMQISWLFGSICVMTLCAEPNEEKSFGRMPPPKNRFKKVEPAVSSSSVGSTETKSKETKKTKSSQDKSGSPQSKSKSKDSTTTKGSGEKGKEMKRAKGSKDGKQDRKRKEKGSLEKTQHDPKSKIKSDAKTKSGVQLLEGNSIGSEQGTLNSPGDLALLAAAEQMAADKRDYDNFGPGVKKGKKKKT
ncbi:hypothetical protein Q1695_012476 [Nippostrongylus brasiliensis]|nr:hypothetical protein Q1695_012476 [Nippostrongylus brasiliensis]